MADDEELEIDVELEDTVNDEILQRLTEFDKRLQEYEDGKAGYYHPTDLDEQRRSWVMEQYRCSELDIDTNLEQIHKANEWLRTGKLPRRKSKHKDEDAEPVVLQLVKDQP